MIEYREDPTKNTMTIISGSRAKRPFVFDIPKGSCFFCKGMEFTTPPATFVLPDEKNWKVRSFKNAFPILSPDEKFEEGKGREYYFAGGYGEHEVIVEAEDHAKLFQTLTEEELKNVWRAYVNRFQEFLKREKIEYIFLFKNHGKRAGASIEHEHSQIISFPFVPELIAREISNQYNVKGGAEKKCIFCALPHLEEKNKVFESRNFTVIAPPFARFSYELWIIPKKHVKLMTELTEDEGVELLSILKTLIIKAQAVTPDYNIIYHNAPKKGDLHFHVEFCPKTSDWAGVELGTGVIIRSKGEEEAVEKFKN